MKKIMIILSIVVVIFVSTKTTEDLIIPDESIRIRVIANSNNSKDQLIKNVVRNNIEKEVTNLLANVTNIDEARTLLEENIDLINERVEDVLVKNNYDVSYKVDFGYNLFPEKKYKGVVYEEGYYESVVVTLGEGKGDNWWCVLFPPLCLMETSSSDLEEIEYKSFIKEIIDKYF